MEKDGAVLHGSHTDSGTDPAVNTSLKTTQHLFPEVEFLPGTKMIVTQILATGAVIAFFIFFWKLVVGRGRSVFSRAPTAEWIFSGFIAILFAWIILNIWGIVPLLTNTAVLSVWFFFSLWFLKDFFIDDYLAGIKLITFYKLAPGRHVHVFNMECEVEAINARVTVLRSPRGRLVVPNSRLVRLGLVLPDHEDSIFQAPERLSAQ